jgi:cis-3-alkyl-4-acyloxetan-2-one decarboxylase
MSTPLVAEQVLVGDVRSPVLIGGPPGGESDEAVVFVHGNPGRGADWRALMVQVAEFARVIAPDMPGFGGAEQRFDMEYTVAAYARHLEGIIDALGVQRVHLVAHDFGGPWAMTWAAANVDRVASVTLINTGVLLEYDWHRAAKVWRTPLAGELFMALARPPLDRALVAHDNPGLDARSLDHIVGVFRSPGTKRAILRLYRSTTQEMMDRLVEPLRAKDLPCLVVWGTNDVYLPTEQAGKQKRPFPSAQIHTIEGAGHWVFFEQPERVAELVVPYLRSQIGPHAPTTV